MSGRPRVPSLLVTWSVLSSVAAAAVAGDIFFPQPIVGYAVSETDSVERLNLPRMQFQRLIPLKD
jgi:hypothetical protein